MKPPIPAHRPLSHPDISSQSLSDAIRIGLVGCGAMGRHHGRVLGALMGVQFVGAVDPDSTVAQQVCDPLSVRPYSSLDELLVDVDALVIATPTGTHFELAARCLNAKKNVLVEKPLADSPDRARKLVELARANNCCCIVGHVERFNPVVRWFRQFISSSEILSINITRVGPRPPRIKGVGIIIDLAVHDIDLIAHLCESQITQIQAVCNSTHGRHEDAAQINIKTMSGAVCGINTNWLTPFKSRRIEIATNDAFYVGDLITGTVTKYQSIDHSGQRYNVETHSPRGLEPLMEQAIGFVNLLRGDSSSPNATAAQACTTVELAASCLADQLPRLKDR